MQKTDLFLAAHQLPDQYLQTLEFIAPCLEKIVNLQKTRSKTLTLGINGCQGSGKSTLAAALTLLLTEQYQLKTVALSLDDFYLTRAERQQLADTIHPLLTTRGVPGTHDVGLLQQTLQQLRQPTGKVLIPRFDKAMDDRKAEFESIQLPLDIVILEGWCLGIPAQMDAELTIPVNALEQEADPDGIWRHFVNAQIKQFYEPLYADIDIWLMLKAPDFNCVYTWRLEQEQKMAARQSGSQIMNTEQVYQFIQYYQRLTEHGLKTLPERVHFLLNLDNQRHIQELHYPQKLR